ncbi:MAG: glycoside hydrolase family 127 protein [Tannerellaceae bacterium]|jgi:hypothetical protein|nr:glycoside hydrolase family 127 protein [Tannerellaceae bacterium]
MNAKNATSKANSGNFAPERQRFLYKGNSRMATVIFAVLFLFLCVCTPEACPYCASPGNGVPDKWKHLPYGKVKIKGEIGRRIDLTISNNLANLDLDNLFLGPFRKKEANDGFIGTGMFLDAAVRFAAYSADPAVVALKDRIVDLLLKNQQDDGYIGFFNPAHRLWYAWDVHEMVYIISGLVSDYNFFGQQRSLDAAVKTADYILSHWGGRPADFPDFYLLGIDKAMLSLYQLTGEERFREFGENKKPLTWAPGIEKGRTARMSGHIFAYMAINEAQLDMYRMTADKRLAKATSDAMDFLTAHDGLSIIGGAGQEESWTDDQDGEGDHAETCATAYMIRIYDNLLRLHGQSFYGDLMERSIYNALFAAQSPDGCKIRYYTPFEGERTYFDNATYCCPNNFRRIVSELPLMIYYTKPEGGIAVNLFAASSANADFADGTKVDIEQITDYPNSGNVVINLKLDKSRAFPLALRIPGYAKDVSVKVNGKPAEGKITAGEFFVIDRTWKAGDRVELGIPMEFRLVAGRKRQSGRVAVMRGPLAYSLSRVANPSVDPGRNKSFQGLGKITLDPASLSLSSDSTVRSNGTACTAKAWRAGFGSNSGKHDYELRLTEFADPEGIVTYFRIPEYSRAGVVEDELTEKLPGRPEFSNFDVR